MVKYTDDGIPFITVTNRAILYCQHGADQHVKTKAKYAESARVRLSFVLQLSAELDESEIQFLHPSIFIQDLGEKKLRRLDQINYVKATTKQ